MTADVIVFLIIMALAVLGGTTLYFNA
ncbi:hypothetical protein SEA_LAMBERT1_66 [Mycobacterium phage Lambert1]|nr:hypothetical protein SEA_TEXAGE_64 [Mycobacterium phage Texage]AOT25567.1 hypothetical protein SEA_MARGO_66 [Mycobacterium phage Margo]AUX82361.1 hypothetical protein SEA_LAMBERT1_66 [Mycobacterium phage Lambert1]AWY03597.1 membrane protein [Mycobacterium phage Hookmount]QBP32275.1 hypothetical protein SEA_NOELLA_66 [Mycobacterium phage Noella]UVK64130.1 membrane protein [Mycobacterium phage Caviar]